MKTAKEKQLQSVKKAIELLSGSHVNSNKHLLGILGRQDIDLALNYLKEYYENNSKK